MIFLKTEGRADLDQFYSGFPSSRECRRGYRRKGGRDWKNEHRTLNAQHRTSNEKGMGLYYWWITF